MLVWLSAQINSGDIVLLYDADSEHWDLVGKTRARELGCLEG